LTISPSRDGARAVFDAHSIGSITQDESGGKMHFILIGDYKGWEEEFYPKEKTCADCAIPSLYKNGESICAICKDMDKFIELR